MSEPWCFSVKVFANAQNLTVDFHFELDFLMKGNITYILQRHFNDILFTSVGFKEHHYKKEDNKGNTNNNILTYFSFNDYR